MAKYGNPKFIKEDIPILKRECTGEIWNANKSFSSIFEKILFWKAVRQPILLAECAISLGIPVVPEVCVI